MIVHLSDGISCYVCEKTTSEQTCISGERLVHDRLKGGRFVRNCTSDNHCLIEAIINAGDCSLKYRSLVENHRHILSKINVCGPQTVAPDDTRGKSSITEA
uniref:Uncharacterized protein n=1 Tax=Magallana gigas TaxID=29159 RepID=K1R3Z3_MAGGI